MSHHGYHPITKITCKYTLKQLEYVDIRDLHKAIEAGVTIDDYIALIA